MKCKLCGANKFKAIYQVQGVPIEKCQKCGLVRTNKTSFASYGAYHRDPDYLKYDKDFENIFAKRFELLSKRFEKPGKVIEIGASTGLLLSIFKAHGWETLGVEPSESAKAARKKSIKIIDLPFEKVDLGMNSFDLAILNHTLEHMTDPLFALKKVNVILKPKGLVYIDVPNFGSLAQKVQKEYWKALLPREHVHHFSKETLTKMLRKANFDTVWWGSWSGIFDVANPIKRETIKIKSRNIHLIADILDLPSNIITTIFKCGTNLAVIGRKKA